MPDRFQLGVLLALFAASACATAEDPYERDATIPRDRVSDRDDASTDAPADTLPDSPGDALPDSPDDALPDSPPEAEVEAEAETEAEADDAAEAEAEVEADADAPPGPCAGRIVGGACWYLSAEERSCETACSSHGGYSDATRTYAGSSGTNAQCDEVLDALGVAGSGTSTLAVSGAAVGCFYMNLADARYRVQDMVTTPEATYTLARRACACNE